MESNQKKTPVTTLRDGMVKATIWENQGKNGVFYNTTFARAYKTSDGSLKDTYSFSQSDLQRIQNLAQMARTQCRALGTGQSAEGTSAQANYASDSAPDIAS